jgi:hypothetical protein
MLDIFDSIRKGKIYIYPLTSDTVKGASINVTASLFAISSRKCVIEKIHNKRGRKYIIVRGGDTVLIPTKELVFINSGKIGGTIHSRVRLECAGFGHISSTVDPWWSGSLLMAINNPGFKKREMTLYDTESQRASIGTIVFHELGTDTMYEHDNRPARIDILSEMVEKQWGFIKKTVFKKQYQLISEVMGILTESTSDSRIDQEVYKKLNRAQKQLQNLKNSLQGQRKKDVAKYKGELKSALSYYDYSEILNKEITAVLKKSATNALTSELKDEFERVFGLINLEFKGLHWSLHLDKIEEKIDDYSKIPMVFKYTTISSIILFVAVVFFIGILVYLLTHNGWGSAITGSVIGALVALVISLVGNKKHN